MSEFFVGLYESENVQENAMVASGCDWCYDPDQCHGCNRCHSCNQCNSCDGCYQPY